MHTVKFSFINIAKSNYMHLSIKTCDVSENIQLSLEKLGKQKQNC